jgi:transposase
MVRRDLQRQAHVGLLTERREKLEHENRCLREALEEERAAHRETKRELARERRAHEELREQFDDIVAETGNLDARYRVLLRKQFQPSSERMAVAGELIPEVLDALAEEGCVAARHRDCDADSQWPDWCDAPDDASCCDGSCCSDSLAHDDAVVNRDCDDLGPFALLDCSDDADTGALWEPMVTCAPRAPQRFDHAGTSQPVVYVRPSNAGGRRALPEHWRREQQVYEPPEDHPDLRHAESYDIIGRRVIEKVDLPDAAPFVRVITCPVVRLHFRDGTTAQQTLAPPAVIPRGQATDRFIVQTAVDKVSDHLPSYRQEQRMARVGAVIPRSKLCRWHIALASFLTVIADAILQEIITEPVIGVDDSVQRQPLPGQGKSHHNRIWAVTIPTAVYYQTTPTREAKWIAAILEPYSGAIMGDACSAHNQVLARDDIIALLCWAHARRYFVDAESCDKRNHMLTLIAQLYTVEDRCVGHDPPARVAIRHQYARPVLDAIRHQLDTWQVDPTVRPTSGIGKAVTYALNQWDGLVRYCDIGTAPIDNNHTERCIRPVAMHRKNSLFCYSDAGVNAYACLLTVIQSAKLNDLDPVAYLLDVIEDLHYQRRFPADLTPHAYACRTKSPAAEPDTTAA